MIERYRQWYEQEKASNSVLLEMMSSLPDTKREDPRFERCLILAEHLCACRENWLDRMVDSGEEQVAWWPTSTNLDDLPGRFAAIEARWTAYLASLADEDLDVDFQFPVSGGHYRWNIEGQIMQLVGHAFYHRGQIALLIDELGGKAVDTDFLFWATQEQPHRWKFIP
jgi:uncharacterized damage-inducible protein DinB